MRFWCFLQSFLVILQLKTSLCFFDPISIISAGVAAGSFIFKKTVCNFKECCNEKGIPANFSGLEQELRMKLYGQHLVIDNVVNALRSHWDESIQPKKPLVMSFHGWAGGGKNYVAHFIKQALYELGSESKFVHQYSGRIAFTLQGDHETYKRKLYQEIKKNVQECSKSLFIIDELDKLPAGVINVLKPIFDYNDQVDRVDYRKSIFIFLSNTGGHLITEKYLKLWEQGYRRNDIKLGDFEQLILEGAFNEEGGLQHSDNIKSNLIDLYIPFLPMEKEHVRLCVIDEFKRRGVHYPDETHVNEVMEIVEYGPSSNKLFSKSGCKRISSRVGVIVKKYHLRHYT